MINPRQHLSQHFKTAELFPPLVLQHATAESLRLALYLSQEVCRTVLEPLRKAVGPIVINVGDSTARGWRTPFTSSGVGSSVGSDHTLLEYNPRAAGAFDINPQDVDRTAELFRVMTEMDSAGAWPYQCRSIIYEHRNGKEWVHVGWPNFKLDHSYQYLVSDENPDLYLGRPPYQKRDTGQEWRYWDIRDRELRRPVEPGAEIVA